MIRIGAAYAVAGVVFAAAAVSAAAQPGRPRRWPRAVFFALMSASFLLGDRLGDVGNGVLVSALILVGVGGRLRSAPIAVLEPAWAQARAVGAWVFLPILTIPAVTLAGTIAFGAIHIGGAPLVDPKQVTVVSLALAACVALAVAMVIIRPPLTAPASEASRLLEGIGSAAILPQLLAALGVLFTLAGVGRSMQTIIGAFVPLDNRLLVIVAFCAGMTLFTAVLGNAFAAFPVMVAALGAPILVGRMGGNPALVGAVGMLSGYCGTLVTPMASFNIIPAALLDLPIGAVIRAQASTAALVLIFNIALIWALAFPH